VVGAAVLLALQTALKRGKFLQALQNEVEINHNRLEKQIYRIESQGDTQFSAFHTGVYEAIRINDPTLFLSLNSEILGFENIYEELNTLDELSEAGVTTKTPQDQLLQSHQQLNKQFEDVIESIKSMRKESLIYRHIGKEGVTLRRQHIRLDEEGNILDE